MFISILYHKRIFTSFVTVIGKIKNNEKYGVVQHTRCFDGIVLGQRFPNLSWHPKCLHNFFHNSPTPKL